MLRVWTVAGEALAALPPGPEFWFHVVLCICIYIYIHIEIVVKGHIALYGGI